MSLNDDCESNVLEVIQNLELLTDLRETSLREVDVGFDWLDCVTCHVWVVVIMSWCCCLKHWTWCCEWFHAHVVWLSCHGIWWRPGKKLRRHLSLSSLRTSGKSDAMIGDTWHFHDMIVNLYRTFYTFEIIRMDQTLKRGTAIFVMMKLWELFCQNVSHRFIIICADLS